MTAIFVTPDQKLWKLVYKSALSWLCHSNRQCSGWSHQFGSQSKDYVDQCKDVPNSAWNTLPLNIWDVLTLKNLFTVYLKFKCYLASWISPGDPSCKSLHLGIFCFGCKTQSSLTDRPPDHGPRKGACVNLHIKYSEGLILPLLFRLKKKKFCFFLKAGRTSVERSLF